MLHRQIQGGPPPPDLDFRDKRPLSGPVDGPLSCPHHPFELTRFAFMELADMNREQPNPFPLSWRDHFSNLEDSVRPFDPVFPPRIPLDDIADIPVSYTAPLSASFTVP